MRGEKVGDTPVSTHNLGSPPHARGKVGALRLLRELEGITPACAGKSDTICQTCTECEDHPRMRGEKRFPISVRKPMSGSPPHARGKARCI